MFYVTESGHTIETSGAVVVQGYTQQYQSPANYYRTNSASSYDRRASSSSVTASAKTYNNASAPPLETLPR